MSKNPLSLAFAIDVPATSGRRRSTLERQRRQRHLRVVDEVSQEDESSSNTDTTDEDDDDTQERKTSVCCCCSPELRKTLWVVFVRMSCIGLLLFFVYSIYAAIITSRYSNYYHFGYTDQDYFGDFWTTFYNLFGFTVDGGWLINEFLQVWAEDYWAWVPFLSFFAIVSFISVPLTIVVIDDAVRNFLFPPIEQKTEMEAWLEERMDNLTDAAMGRAATNPSETPVEVDRKRTGLQKRNLLLRKLVVIFSRLFAIGLLLLALYLIYAALLTNWFGDKSDFFHYYFESFGASMFTLFTFMVDGGVWGDVQDWVMAVYPWAWAPFLSFFVLSSFIAVPVTIVVMGDAVRNLFPPAQPKTEVDAILEMKMNQLAEAVTQHLEPSHRRNLEKQSFKLNLQVDLTKEADKSNQDETSHNDFFLGDPVVAEPTSCLGRQRNALGKSLHSTWSHGILAVLLLLNLLVFAMVSHYADSPGKSATFDRIKFILLSIFTIEVGLRLFYLGPCFIARDLWTTLNIMVILPSYMAAPVFRNFQVFRSMELLRLFARYYHPSSSTKQTWTRSNLMVIFQRMLIIALLLLVVYLIYAAVITAKYGSYYKRGITSLNYFGRFDYTLYSLFGMMVDGGAMDLILREVMEHDHTTLPIFLSFFTIVTFISLPMTIVVLDDAVKNVFPHLHQKTATEALLESKMDELIDFTAGNSASIESDASSVATGATNKAEKSNWKSQLRKVLIIVSRLLAIGFALLLLYVIFAAFSVSFFSDLYQNGLISEDFFGSFGLSMFTLFVFMVDGGTWMETSREVMEVYKWAWAPYLVFFVSTAFLAVPVTIVVMDDAVRNLFPPVRPKSETEFVLETKMEELVEAVTKLLGNKRDQIQKLHPSSALLDLQGNTFCSPQSSTTFPDSGISDQEHSAVCVIEPPELEEDILMASAIRVWAEYGVSGVDEGEVQ